MREFALNEYGGLVGIHRSEEHTSELQSHVNLVCRLLLEKNCSRFSSRSMYCSMASRMTQCGERRRATASRCMRSLVSLSIFTLFFFFIDRAPPNFAPFPYHTPLPP